MLIVLTAVEIALVVAVLAAYLRKIAQSLRATAGYLGKTNVGVRAIESQCEPIGPSVTRINEQLASISSALAGVADMAEQLPTDGPAAKNAVQSGTGRKNRG